MSTVWHDLLANLAVVALVVSFWNYCQDKIEIWPPLAQSIAFGSLMGSGAVALMNLPFQLQPGVFVDLRTSMIAMSSFFGGPSAGLMAAFLALSYRLYTGGAGAAAGCAGISIAFIVALCGNFALRGRRPKRKEIALLAVATATANALSLFILPRELWHKFLLEATAPIWTLTCVSTTLCGFAIYSDKSRRDAMKSNHIYRAIIEALPDCLNAKDTRGRFLAVNPATAKLMRAESPEALLGKTDFDFYPYEIASKFQKDEERALTRGEASTIEQHFLHKDGSGGWLSTLKAPFWDERGKLAGVISLNRDITDTKRLEDELIS